MPIRQGASCLKKGCIWLRRNDMPIRVDPANLENILCDIEANRRNLSHGGWLLSRFATTYSGALDAVGGRHPPHQVKSAREHVYEMPESGCCAGNGLPMRNRPEAMQMEGYG